jgi:hypothetical protein
VADRHDHGRSIQVSACKLRALFNASGGSADSQSEKFLKSWELIILRFAPALKFSTCQSVLSKLTTIQNARLSVDPAVQNLMTKPFATTTMK